ncbi:MAG: hypothetical protein ACK55I_11430, partial [bacterium]
MPAWARELGRDRFGQFTGVIDPTQESTRPMDGHRNHNVRSHDASSVDRIRDLPTQLTAHAMRHVLPRMGLD